MNIKQITAKNFFRTGNNEQIINISNNGLTSIVANNGIGKSTMFCDSVIYALYGKFKTDKVDDIVNSTNKKDCKVSVTFEQNGEIYKVIRYRSHTTQKNNVYLFKGDKDISGHTVSETNQRILDLIKMPYIAFTNSCLFSSELYSKFLETQNSERIKIFENILSLKEITSMYVACKDIIKEKNLELETKKIEKSSKEAEVAAIENSVTNYAENAKRKLLELKEKKLELEKNVKKLEEKKEEYSSIDIEEERKKVSNSSLKEEFMKTLNELKEKAQDAQINYNKAEERKSKAEFIINKYYQYDFDAEIEKEKKYNEGLSLINIKQNALTKLSGEYETKLANIGSYKEKINHITSQINESTRKMSSIKIAKCPECNQDINKEEVERQKSEIDKKMLYYQSELDGLTSEMKNLSQEAEEIENNKKDLADEILKIKSSIDSNYLKNPEACKKEFELAKESLNEVSGEMLIYLKEQDDAKERGKAILLKMKDLQTSKYSEEELNNLSFEIKKIDDELLETRSEIKSIDKSHSTIFDSNYLNDMKNNLEKSKKELEKAQDALLETANIIKHYEYLLYCFSGNDGGFKKHFIGEMIDSFNDYIRNYIPFFFEDMEVEMEFDKNLDFSLKVDGEKRNYKAFSKGQKNRAEMVVAFALFRIARVFFSNDCNMLLFDEMSDGLDSKGLEGMVSVLKAFSEECHVYVIDHNPIVKELISDDKIEIKLDSNGFTEVVQ